jgi:hypothetical protein
VGKCGTFWNTVMELRQFPRDRDFFPETETFFSRPSRDRDIRVPRPSRDRDTRVPRPSRDRDREVPRPSRDRDICKKSRDRAETFKNLSRDCLEPRHLSRGLHHWFTSIFGNRTSRDRDLNLDAETRDVRGHETETRPRR